MGLLSWIAVGLIAGWLAGQYMRGSVYGVVGDLSIGVIGALAGVWLAEMAFGIPNALSRIDLESIACALLGAVVVIGMVRFAGVALGDQRSGLF